MAPVASVLRLVVGGTEATRHVHRNRKLLGAAPRDMLRERLVAKFHAQATELNAAYDQLGKLLNRWLSSIVWQFGITP